VHHLFLFTKREKIHNKKIHIIMQSLKLRPLLASPHLTKLLLRHSTFTVNLNVKAIDSIEIAADKVFGPGKKVSVRVYDSHGRLQNGSQMNIMQREDGFYMNYNRCEDDKLVVSLPLTARLAEFGEKFNSIPMWSSDIITLLP
jgi:hypothetical protein